MIQGDHEDAPGQIELNFNYDDAFARPTGSRPTGRSAAKSPANSTSSPASCASRSWAFPRTAAITISRFGLAAPMNSIRSATTKKSTGIRAQLHVSAGRHQLLHAGRQRSADAWPDRPLLHRRHRQTSCRRSRLSAARQSTPIGDFGIQAFGHRSLPTGDFRTARAGFVFRLLAASNIAPSTGW